MRHYRGVESSLLLQMGGIFSIIIFFLSFWIAIPINRWCQQYLSVSLILLSAGWCRTFQPNSQQFTYREQYVCRCCTALKRRFQRYPDVHPALSSSVLWRGGKSLHSVFYIFCNKKLQLWKVDFPEVTAKDTTVAVFGKANLKSNFLAKQSKQHFRYLSPSGCHKLEQ